MAQHYKIKAARTGFWEKHTYINNTPYQVVLISGKDFDTPLTTLWPHTKRNGTIAADSQTVTINMSIVDATGQHFYFSPDK